MLDNRARVRVYPRGEPVEYVVLFVVVVLAVMLFGIIRDRRKGIKRAPSGRRIDKDGRK